MRTLSGAGERATPYAGGPMPEVRQKETCRRLQFHIGATVVDELQNRAPVEML